MNTYAWTHSHMCTACCYLHLLLVLSSALAFLLSSDSSLHFCCQLLHHGEQSLVSMADFLFDHHAAAELLLRRQTQLLHVRLCAPHGWFGHDGEGALGRRLGQLLDAAGGVRVGLLADVQTGLEEVSSGGHGGQRGVAG